MAISRFTRSEIGIIAERSKINLKKFMYHPDWNPSRATIPNDMPAMKKQRNLDRRLISRSSLPTFVVYSDPFISDRVSLPV